jgi:hypothetical protein
VISYFAGVLTLPALAFVCFGAWACFHKPSEAREACEHCKAAGYRAVEHGFRERTGASIWFTDLWHLHVTSKRSAHRCAWQARYDAHPDGGVLQEHLAPYRDKCGIPETTH